MDASAFGLAVTMRWRMPSTPRMWLNDGGPIGASLLRVGGEAPRALARSGLDVSCVARAEERGYQCFAFDGRDTHIWDVDAAAAALSPQGTVAGVLYSAAAGANGTIVALQRGRPAIVRPGAGDILQLTWPGQRCCRSREVAYAAERVAVLEYSDGPGVVTLYALSAPAPRSQSARAAN